MLDQFEPTYKENINNVRKFIEDSYRLTYTDLDGSMFVAAMKDELIDLHIFNNSLFKWMEEAYETDDDVHTETLRRILSFLGSYLDSYSDINYDGISAMIFIEIPGDERFDNYAILTPVTYKNEFRKFAKANFNQYRIRKSKSILLGDEFPVTTLAIDKEEMFYRVVSGKTRKHSRDNFW